MKGLNLKLLFKIFFAVAILCPWQAGMTAESASTAAISDVHLHYTWDQQGVTSPQDAIDILKENDVVFGIVIGTPPELAHEISKLTDGWVKPIFSPYLTPQHRMDWFADKNVLVKARTGLQNKQYFGIGEVHLVAGLGPRLSNPVLTGLIELAIEFDVPFLVHIETSSHKYFLPLCKKYSKARFLLAHAGGLLNEKNISALMQACKNVWVEFSARDHLRYIDSPIVDDKGQLLPGWLALIQRYPERFMIGSDPVWPIEERHRWDRPDTGWQKLGTYLAFHRKWLSFIPGKLADKIRHENALEFFRYKKNKKTN
jgi:predicted TIM-barrel fold metal-dependent hydrolase